MEQNKRKYFGLNGNMYHKNCIEWVKVDGGGWGFGCWGEIKLKHEKESRVIGDGSYYNDGKHTPHSLAGWDFWRIKEIIRDELGENTTDNLRLSLEKVIINGTK